MIVFPVMMVKIVLSINYKLQKASRGTMVWPRTAPDLKQVFQYFWLA